ncbi:hypothetical protein LguiA_015282 [Lonicera macranthoides]
MFRAPFQYISLEISTTASSLYLDISECPESALLSPSPSWQRTYLIASSIRQF